MKLKRDALAEAPKQRRFSAGPAEQELKVDRNGGYRKAGIIRGASVVTRGEALGHGFWLDEDFVDSVHISINEPNKGVKSRFTHPSMSSDGLATHLGRAMTGVKTGNQVLADFHFTTSSHSTPDGGDLSGYVMTMAEESPEDIALSIVFDPDFDSEREHFVAHGGEIEFGEYGEEIWDATDFTSPDPLNAQNLPHARLADLQAVDFVGDPAANPGGLFGKQSEFAVEADDLCAFAFGLSDKRPATVSLGLDADRVRSFARRFLANHKLEIKKMNEPANPVTPAVVVPEENKEHTPATPAPAPAPAASPAPVATDPAAEPTPQLSSVRAEAKPYVDAFGQQGAVWFLEGKCFSECQALHSSKKDAEVAALNDRIGKLEQRLSAAGALTGQDSPLPFNATDTSSGKQAGFANRIKFAVSAN
jgi:hypothetical protein